jgi:hypothetical protein
MSNQGPRKDPAPCEESQTRNPAMRSAPTGDGHPVPESLVRETVGAIVPNGAGPCFAQDLLRLMFTLSNARKTHSRLYPLL